MTTIETETELKYDAPGDIALPELDQIPAVSEVSQTGVEHMLADYFDTADLRLVRSRCVSPAVGYAARCRPSGRSSGAAIPATWHRRSAGSERSSVPRATARFSTRTCARTSRTPWESWSWAGLGPQKAARPKYRHWIT
jgi:hypothetical protein